MGLAWELGLPAALLLMGSIRELLGSGTLFGITITANILPPMLVFILPPGGFLVFGILIALANKLSGGKQTNTEFNCLGCPGCANAQCAGIQNTNASKMQKPLPANAITEVQNK